jgi:phosphoadenosine phosphosulfate reductase
MSQILEALATLKKAREGSDSIIVSYSGGKDSLIVADMCVRTFPRTELFIMEFVPGLEVVAKQIRLAKERWGKTVHSYPHWNAIAAVRNATYCAGSWKNDDLPEIGLQDIYRIVRADLGIDLIACGFKKSDGIWRNRQLQKPGVMRNVVTPILGFQKADVLGYLRAHRIPLPDAAGGDANGIGFAHKTILWLHDYHPEDFKRFCAVFPYAEAVVWRRTYYEHSRSTRGIPADTGADDDDDEEDQGRRASA